MKTAILLISASGLPVARALSRELKETILVSTKPVEGCLRVDSLQDFVRQAFLPPTSTTSTTSTEPANTAPDTSPDAGTEQSGRPWDALIFIGAMGICVRTIAPYVGSKYTDPAVVCVDTTGRYAVSVLSGHVGGANRLTATVAGILGAEPVVTTQSDRTGLWALDTLPQRFHWAVQVTGPTGKHDVPGSLNEPIALFVAGEPTALLLELRDAGTDWLEAHLPGHVEVFYRREDIDCTRFRLLISVSWRMPADAPILTVCYLPRAIHLGIGLARQAGPVDEVQAHIVGELRRQGIAMDAVADIATVTIKRDEPVVRSWGASYPIRLFTPEQLAQVPVPTPSDTVRRHVGTASVCEAAAILAASQDDVVIDPDEALALLVLTKQKGSNYTVAAAIDCRYIRRGHVEIVGAGPGDPDLISVRGRQMLERADLILYAGSLVPREVTACAKPGATVRSSASLNLQEQLALMKEFYDRGRFIVRLHTGDPCIYGAIEEQMDYFDRHGMRYHITPGISSFQAAAAALRSEFTIPERVQTIVLTRGEGRTSMPEREKLHLLARSQSTMCIFLSASIARQVQEELLQEYPPETPVAVCHHLTWPDEAVYRGRLCDLARIVDEHRLTLTTLIVVGEAIGNRRGQSRLYAAEFGHLFRKAVDDER